MPVSMLLKIMSHEVKYIDTTNIMMIKIYQVKCIYTLTCKAVNATSLTLYSRQLLHTRTNSVV